MESDFCVACGGPALPKSRRVVKGEIGMIWAKIFHKELERRQLQLNFTTTRENYMCRRCHGGYLKIVDTEQELAQRVENAVSVIIHRSSSGIPGCPSQSTNQPSVSHFKETPSQTIISRQLLSQETALELSSWELSSQQLPSQEIFSPQLSSQQQRERKRSAGQTPLSPPPARRLSLPTTPSTGPRSAGFLFPTVRPTSIPTTTSPSVSVNIDYACGTRKYSLTPSRRHIGKAVARSSNSTLATEALKNPTTRRYIVKKVGILLRKELVSMCSDKTKSVLKTLSLEEFTWKHLISELSTTAPTLYSLLLSCTHTRKPRQNRDAVIGVCCAVLLKFRYSKMNLWQKIVSLILYAGRSGKMVYERLQKAGICLSHSTACKLVTMLGEGHDTLVKEWRDQFSLSLKANHETINQSSSHHQSAWQPLLQASDEEWVAIADSMSDYSSESSSDDNTSELSDNDFSGSEVENLDEMDTSDLTTSPDCTMDQDISGAASLEGELAAANESAQLPSTPKFLGYKLVGDNIDKGVKARFMRVDEHRGQSLHYFHYCAIQNRVDFTGYPDVHPDTCLDSPQRRAQFLLPSDEDDKVLANNFTILVSRILYDNMPFFKVTFDGIVTWHIQHENTAEMSKKSVVVPLGVILKNENKGDEMVDILSELHQYVPSFDYGEKVYEVPSGRTLTVPQTCVRRILVAGDQLTAARVRAAKRARANSLSVGSRLEGLEPTAADFHVLLNLLDVAWKYFYSTDSTLYQLRNVIGRTNVNGDPVHKFNECDDFFKLVVTCHVLVAAMKVLSMESLDDVPLIPGTEIPAGDLWMESNEKRREVFQSICDRIVSKFGQFRFQTALSPSSDKVHEYATKLLGFGLFYLELRDAIREGDGQRVLRCWKYLLPIFKSSNRHNYSVEVLNMLAQFYYKLTPREAQELIWSRFVNTHSTPGHNIPEDLHQEHLNRVIKDCIKGLAANKTAAAVTKVGKALGALYPMLGNYDEDNSVTNPSGRHKVPNWDKDRNLVIDRLLIGDVFTQKKEKRYHLSFQKPRDFLRSMKQEVLVNWMASHLK